MKIAFINDSSQRLGIQYLGVQSISAVLKAEGHQTELFVDPQLFNDSHCSIKSLSRFFDFKQDIIKQLKEYQPDIIGFSVVTDLYPWACEMATLIKKEMNVPIIFGGVHSSSVPERVIKNDVVDIVCVGEGEYPMLELINSMAKGQIDYSIKNLWFKNNGKIIKNELRPLVENLDKLPFPDISLYSEEMGCLKNRYYIAASRGCPNRCSYCLHSYFHDLYKANGRYVRKRSVENVISELIQARTKYSIKKTLFTDDCFGSDINWLKKFAIEYKQKINVPYLCIMQPADVTQESVDCLKKSDCCFVFLGIQSWDKDLRESLLDRYVKNDSMQKAIKLIKKARIQVVVDNLMGLPGQSNESLINSNMEYAELRPNRIFFFELRYYPKTAILDKALNEGFVNEGRYQRILNGEDQGGLCVKRPFYKRDKIQNNFNKAKMLLFMLDVFPASIINFIVKKKIYNYFPSFFDMSIFMLFRTLFSRDLDSRLRVYESFAKYAYFMKKKLKLFIKGKG